MRGAALALGAVGLVAVAAAVSTLAGADGGAPLPAPPEAAEASPAPVAVDDPPLAGRPTGALDALPAVPAERARDVVVLYDERCNGFLLHLDRPNAMLLVDLPVPGSCTGAWSLDARAVADATAAGVVLRDRPARRSRTTLPDVAFVPGSARVGEGGAAACALASRPYAFAPDGTPTSLAGTCPVGILDGAPVSVAAGGQPLVGLGGATLADRLELPPGGSVAAVAESPSRTAIAVLGTTDAAAWLRVRGTDGGVAAVALPAVSASGSLPPEVAVADDARTAVATLGGRATVVRIDGTARVLDALAGQPLESATLAPDGRSVAVATAGRVVVLDAATLAPVGAVPLRARRLLWLDAEALR